MFNLDRAITEWRRQMLAAGIKSPVPLEELEGHLREEVKRQTESGVDAGQAFGNAVKQMGCPTALKAEFKKISADQWAREDKWMRVYCNSFPVIYTGIGIYALLRVDMDPGLRLFGFTALMLTSLLVWTTPYFYTFLPAIADKRRRMGIQIGSALVWMIGGGLFMNLILPHMNLTQGQIVATVLWLMMPVAAIAGISYGLGVSSRRCSHPMVR